MNDSRGLNRQSGREDPRAIDVSDVALSTDAIATDSVAHRPADRAAAFRRLVGGSLDDAYRRAAVLLGNRFEAEDAVRDAAERAWRSWGSFRNPAQFDAWFGRILVNVCRDRLRRRRRVAVIEVRAHDVDNVDAADGPRARLSIALRIERESSTCSQGCLPTSAWPSSSASRSLEARLRTSLVALRPAEGAPASLRAGVEAIPEANPLPS